MTTLKASNLAKSYKGRAVVEDVSISVSSGEIVGLLGPNGAGKTTCFYMILGIIAADKGQITIDEQDITYTETKSFGLSALFFDFPSGPFAMKLAPRAGARLSASLRSTVASRTSALFRTAPASSTCSTSSPTPRRLRQRTRVEVRRAQAARSACSNRAQSSNPPRHRCPTSSQGCSRRCMK